MKIPHPVATGRAAVSCGKRHAVRSDTDLAIQDVMPFTSRHPIVRLCLAATFSVVLPACENPIEQIGGSICLLDPTMPIELPCSPEPRRVVDDVGFVAIAAGQDHTCALTADGRPYCWGRMLYEPVDFRTGAGISTRPVPLSGDQRFIGIAAGESHTCALTEAGEAWCWVANHSGQLGISARAGELPPFSLTPARVAGEVVFTTLGPGRQHSCAIAAGGAAYCWGMDWYGEVGRGFWRMEVQPTPFPVVGHHEFTAIGSGQRFTCALRVDGEAWCWGHGHIGELGTRQTAVCADPFMNTRCSPSPVRVAISHRFVGIATGATHTCAITAEGRTFCWGDTGQGQLGPGAGDGFTPVEVAGHAFAAIHAGGSTSCGTTAGGETLCWGGNWQGQLGTGSLEYADPTPTRIAGGHRFTALSVGFTHACGIADSGATYCWGSNERGQLGAGVW
jgi:alpha-tubulin suppressor-like RCC1 family protein